jgi:N-acetyl-gamma-glutamyl-phosphate reductase
MINIGIVGAAGYSGLELIKLLINHPQVKISKLFGSSSVGSKIEEIHTALRGLISLGVEKFDKNNLTDIDLLFVALPSGQSMSIIKEAVDSGIKVIDIGGDFRLENIGEYTKYYKHEHTAQDLLKKAVYGLSEWNEEEIKKANLVANPGCYPTSIQLALLPLLKNNLLKDELISIVSYSGTSGAGKSLAQNMLFSEVNESVRAYKVGSHQHIPEIKQYLKKFSGKNPKFSFVPHLLPATRGIYTTIHATLQNSMSKLNVVNVFESAYTKSPFVRVLPKSIPELKDVVNTNFCDIGFEITDNDTIVIISTIDNLVKGAAGQAIQNMNIMFGFDQTEGIHKCNKKN